MKDLDTRFLLFEQRPAIRTQNLANETDMDYLARFDRMMISKARIIIMTLNILGDIVGSSIIIRGRIANAPSVVLWSSILRLLYSNLPHQWNSLFLLLKDSGLTWISQKRSINIIRIIINIYWQQNIRNWKFNHFQRIRFISGRMRRRPSELKEIILSYLQRLHQW